MNDDRHDVHEKNTKHDEHDEIRENDPHDGYERYDGHDPFGGDGPIDAEAADGDLALAPPPIAAAGRPRYSWQCRLEEVDVARCDVDVPGSVDFPQHGDGTCAHGSLVYRPRRPA
ncbi:hypothetical protein [Streptomyces sp. NPDC048606]|uniref:hypothetical protein n=1 Tax=Streptomyces sp. NPDC048606 TaxID=3154726 RepID=UPI00341E7EAC